MSKMIGRAIRVVGNKAMVEINDQATAYQTLGVCGTPFLLVGPLSSQRLDRVAGLCDGTYRGGFAFTSDEVLDRAATIDNLAILATR